MATGPSPLQLGSPEQKELDDIWQQVQAKVVELGGGDAQKIQQLGIGDVIQQLDSYNDKKKPESYAKFKNVINRTLQCIETVGNIVTQGVSTVITPASTCYSALTFVIQAWRGYEGIFENLSELLEKCLEFLDRLCYYDRKMDATLTRLACQNLRLFVEICDRIVRLRRKHTRFLAFTKKLFLNDDGVQGLLDLMEKLNKKESLLVAAQTFQIVNDSAGDLKIVIEEQMEQKTKQDSKQRRHQIADALNFRGNELTSAGEPTAMWRRTLDSHMSNIVADTGDWLLNDPNFLDWAQAPVPSKPIMILQGTTYTGKTSMMASVLRFLRKQEGNMPTSRIVTAYFFPDEEMKQPDKSEAKPILENVSKALLWQIAVSFEALTKSIAQKFQTSNGFTGWLDLWEQLYIDNPERLNPDTTFFLFIDGTGADDSDLNSLVPLLQKLIAATNEGKTRIFLTAEPKVIADHVDQFNNVPVELVDLPSRNKTDIEKYITHRMDSMPILRDPTRPGISEWRKRIIDKLSEKCLGDYFKLNSSLHALAHMDLVEDIEEVLTRADETRSDQIQAEIAHINKSRTPKEIQEINEIINWIESGRRWFSVNTMEALLSVKHQKNAATADASAPLQKAATGSLTAALASSNGTLTVSLLSFSERLLQKYSFFTLSREKEVRWRDPETKSQIPNKSALQLAGSTPSNSSGGRQQVGESEISIVRHFLHSVCPPNLYSSFDFETFFESKLRAQTKQYICIDEENSHIRIVIAYLTIMTSETLKATKDLLVHARRDLLFHLSKVNLSTADPALKTQVGPLLVRLLTEECGVTALFLPGDSSFQVWRKVELPDLKDVRAEWLYSLEGAQEVLRWLSDPTVTKLISGKVAESYVQDVNTLGRNLHEVMFYYAAKHLASRFFYSTTSKKRFLNSTTLFLRGYLMRCDPETVGHMATDSAFYKAGEAELAKEIEGLHNFDVEMLQRIENWASNALEKSTNSPAQDSLWEYQAFSILEYMSSSTKTDESIARVKKALELDSTNFRARLVLASLKALSDQEAIEALSAVKKDLEANADVTNSELLASATLRLGNRVWDAGEDRALAKRYHIESLYVAYVGWELPSVLTRYKEASDYESIVGILKALGESHEIWKLNAGHIYPILDQALWKHADMIAKAAEEKQEWDALDKFFNLMADSLRGDEQLKLTIECLSMQASFFANSSQVTIRDRQMAIHEAALADLKENPVARDNLPKVVVFLAINELASLYLEKALVAERGSEEMDSYLSKLASLVSMAEVEGNISQAVTPACSLIVFNRESGQFSDIAAKWTHKIMLEVIELLSDDDDSNDLEAYLYLLQLLISLQDFDNVRVAFLMIKWDLRGKYIEQLDAAAQLQMSSNKHLTHKSGGEDNAESEACPAAEGPSPSKPDAVPVDEDNSSDVKEQSDPADNATEAAAPESSDAASNHDGGADEKPQRKIWPVYCDGCSGNTATEDHEVYLCTECVTATGFDPDCYQQLMAGTYDKQTDCSKEHKFTYIPAWKPGVELLKGHVPVLETVAEGSGVVEMVGWITMDEWKANLRSLYIKN